jgi:hypothetical protein
MSESAQTPMAKTAPPAVKSSSPAASGGSGRRAAIVAAVGAIFIVGAVGFVLMKADLGTISGNPAQPTVSFVAKRDISEAASTWMPAAAGALVDDAERCKIPLAAMTISKGTAAIGTVIRIRSGSYVSPYFTVTEGMQRIAVPYPAPYGSGAGTFIVEGNASGAILGLTPTKTLLDLPGTQNIPVVWRVVSPC